MVGNAVVVVELQCLNYLSHLWRIMRCDVMSHSRAVTGNCPSPLDVIVTSVTSSVLVQTMSTVLRQVGSIVRFPVLFDGVLGVEHGLGSPGVAYTHIYIVGIGSQGWVNHFLHFRILSEFSRRHCSGLLYSWNQIIPANSCGTQFPTLLSWGTFWNLEIHRRRTPTSELSRTFLCPLVPKPPLFLPTLHLNWPLTTPLNP